MKTMLIAINSKYIHPNLAVRYLKANTHYPVDVFEYTIKDTQEKIIEDIMTYQAHLIGFSVYIWNIEIIKALLKKIRALSPKTKLLLGGPEVSYVNEGFFKDDLADYIIVNEGEESFNLLLEALHQEDNLKNIPNLIYKEKDLIIKNKIKIIKNLDNLNNPYFILDHDDYQHKIQYLELSRGCPYQCAYCLASLEKGLRFFSLDHVKEILDSLIKRGGKTFKFLDRSFNANPKLAQEFLEYIISRNDKNIVYQFEINGDVLKKPFIEFLVNKAPKNLIRFELGIQSTNDQVNQEVNRYQDTQKLIANIQELKKSNVTLHLDLIAGLPYEDLNSFKNTFNTIYQLFPDELQLGFLKILKGTSIYYKTKEHQINYQQVAPYEIIDSKYIDQASLEIIHQVETMLNIYWNKGFLNKSIKFLTKDMDAFDFYLQMYDFFKKKNYSTLRYHFKDLFIYLIEFLKVNQLFTNQIESYLKYDFLNHYPIKPQIYWEHLDNKNDILRSFHQKHPEFKIDDLYKYALVTDYLDGYLIVLYHPKHKDIIEYKND
ncbi:DUF4080 domain-containing protein [Hujiaoplasma nucleasis]|uniref:DUF4080 domain-containing protein n=1 Tax=Hujiaoplasma nucleasis TaxID=2725268 RepID=A0A7L6N2V1_9MOLU|nr:B12-binding domain-containing radical SAM protein [Hujiaoplasma nucleasis]QLY40596.1 DUF4080 domain-containing protein [Hujiaoplasma nucleasis]